MKINKYDIIELSYDYKDLDYDFFSKNKEITNILFDIIKEEDVYLFEFYPIRGMTLIEDLSDSYEYNKCNNNEYLYTTQSIKLSKDDLSQIVEYSFFQLGRLAIVLSDLTEKTILDMMIFWTDERPLAGIEMIRLDYDGLCLLFYNMKDNKKLGNVIDNLSKHSYL